MNVTGMWDETISLRNGLARIVMADFVGNYPLIGFLMDRAVLCWSGLVWSGLSMSLNGGLIDCG